MKIKKMKSQYDIDFSISKVAISYIITIFSLYLYGVDISFFNNLTFTSLITSFLLLFYYQSSTTFNKYLLFNMTSRSCYLFVITIILTFIKFIDNKNIITVFIDRLNDNIIIYIIYTSFINIIFFKLYIFSVSSKLFSSARKFYSKHSGHRYLYNILITFLVLLDTIQVVYFPLNYECLNISIMLSVMLSVFILFTSFIKPRYSELFSLSVSYSNIKYEDVTSHQIYELGKLDKGETYRIICIKLDSLFPKDSKDEEFIVLNHPYVGKNKVPYIKDKFLYFCVPFKNYSECYRVKLKYKYLMDDKEYAYKINFFIEIQNIDSKPIPFIKNFVFNTNKLWINKNINYSKLIRSKDTLNYENSYIHNYYFGDEVQKSAELIKKKSIDSRKFIKHDGDYGEGKTIYDINSIIMAGRKPVIVSPWEDDYDHDILYLIFKRVKKESRTYLHRWRPYCWMFYIWILIAVYTLIIANFENVEKFIDAVGIYNIVNENNIIMNKNMFYIFDNLWSVLLVIALLVYIVLKLIIPYLIVFKNSYSTIYQDFFIKEIIRMIQNNQEIFILIEDIDRLDKEKAENVFRIISAINRAAQYKNEFIGLLSYSSINLNNKELNDMLIDLENKVCYGNIGENYNEHLAKKGFLENILSDKFSENVNLEKDVNFLRKINFRDINEFVNTYVLGIEYDNVETIINQLKDFSTRKEQERVNNKKLSKED